PRRVTVALEKASGEHETVTLAPNALDPSALALRLGPASGTGAPEPPRSLARLGEEYWFEEAADGTVYLQFNRVQDSREESLEAFAKRLCATLDREETHDLIVDVRYN